MSTRIHDYIKNDELTRLQAHFDHCNAIECDVCQLFGKGVKKLSKAFTKMTEG